MTKAPPGAGPSCVRGSSWTVTFPPFDADAPNMGAGATITDTRRNGRALVRAVLVFAALLTTLLTAPGVARALPTPPACTDTWTGLVSSVWTVPGNWDHGTPSGADVACLGAGATATISGNTVMVGGLQIDHGTVTLVGSATLRTTEGDGTDAGDAQIVVHGGLLDVADGRLDLGADTQLAILDPTNDAASRLVIGADGSLTGTDPTAGSRTVMSVGPADSDIVVDGGTFAPPNGTLLETAAGNGHVLTVNAASTIGSPGDFLTVGDLGHIGDVSIRGNAGVAGSLALADAVAMVAGGVTLSGTGTGTLSVDAHATLEHDGTGIATVSVPIGTMAGTVLANGATGAANRLTLTSLAPAVLGVDGVLHGGTWNAVGTLAFPSAVTTDAAVNVQLTGPGAAIVQTGATAGVLSGASTVGTGAAFTVAAGATFAATGLWNVQAGGTLTVGAGSAASFAAGLASAGELDVTGGSLIVSAGGLGSSGSMVIGSAGSVGTNTLTSSGTLTLTGAGSLVASTGAAHASGAVTLGLGTTLRASMTDLTAGNLMGDGTVDGGLTQDGGVIQPSVPGTPDVPATLTIRGAFLQNAGRLMIPINNTAVGSLGVGGNASLTAAGTTFDGSFTAPLPYPLTGYLVRTATAGTTTTISGGTWTPSGTQAPASVGALGGINEQTAIIDAQPSASGIAVRIIERTAPSAPADLTTNRVAGSTVTSRTINAAWSAATDDTHGSGVAGYRVSADQNAAVSLGAVDGAFTLSRGAAFTGLADGTWYVHVAAIDQSGNVGPTLTAGPFGILDAVSASPAPIDTVSTPRAPVVPTAPATIPVASGAVHTLGLTVARLAAPRLAVLLQSGLTVSTHCDRACSVSGSVSVTAAQATLLGLLSTRAKTKLPVAIGTATSVARGAGTVTLRVRLTAKAVRALRGTARLGITVTLRGAAIGATTVTVSRSLRLR